LSGDIWIGSDKKKDKDVNDRELPQHQLHLPEFFMGKTPVIKVQYAGLVKSAKHSVCSAHWKGGKIPP